jgi:hypothetical protein
MTRQLLTPSLYTRSDQVETYYLARPLFIFGNCKIFLLLRNTEGNKSLRLLPSLAKTMMNPQTSASTEPAIKEKA